MYSLWVHLYPDWVQMSRQLDSARAARVSTSWSGLACCMLERMGNRIFILGAVSEQMTTRILYRQQRLQ